MYAQFSKSCPPSPRIHKLTFRWKVYYTTRLFIGVFLDQWPGCLPWRPEHHLAVTLFCDTSQRAWGRVLVGKGPQQEIRDYFVDSSSDINVLEAQALQHVLDSFKDRLQNSRVDVLTDSQVLLSSWLKDGCRNSEINSVLTVILDCLREWNFTLQMNYVPSGDNPADHPQASRECSDLDCTLSESAWALVVQLYGPYTFDLMALDSNCRRDSNGVLLPHFFSLADAPVQWSQCLRSAGTDWAQHLRLSALLVNGPFAALPHWSAETYRLQSDCTWPSPSALLVGYTPVHLRRSTPPGAPRECKDSTLSFTTFIWISSQASSMGSVGFSMSLSLTFRPFVISHRFRVLGRPPAAVVPVYTRMIWTPIFVKHVVRPSIYRRLPRKQEILTSLQLNGVSTNLPLPFVANLISFKNIVYRTTSQNFCWPCPPKTITSCTADDVIKFLISRDGGGRTVIHDPSYPKDKCRFPSIRICSL